MDQLISKYRKQIKFLAEQRGAKRVSLFGSRALGTSGPNSDVDILVELEAGRSAFALGGLQQDLEELLHTKVDVVTPASLHTSLREKILQQAVDL
jgi:hypothetical protein